MSGRCGSNSRFFRCGRDERCTAFKIERSLRNVAKRKSEQFKRTHQLQHVGCYEDEFTNADASRASCGERLRQDGADRGGEDEARCNAILKSAPMERASMAFGLA